MDPRIGLVAGRRGGARGRSVLRTSWIAFGDEISGNEAGVERSVDAVGLWAVDCLSLGFAIRLVGECCDLAPVHASRLSTKCRRPWL